MVWAEGYVQDATSRVGIPYATMYDYVDGYWTANQYGWWATPDAYPGMVIQASAAGYNPNSATLSEHQNDPAVGDVLWAVILLSRAAPTGGGSTTHSGW